MYGDDAAPLLTKRDSAADSARRRHAACRRPPGGGLRAPWLGARLPERLARGAPVGVRRWRADCARPVAVLTPESLIPGVVRRRSARVRGGRVRHALPGSARAPARHGPNPHSFMLHHASPAAAAAGLA